MNCIEKFKLISSIEVDNLATWENKLFLTFDIDWAHDEVISDTLNLLYNNDVPATFFATHESPVLKSVIEDNKHEVGIHPNFNDLINNTCVGENAESRLKYLLDLFPSAKSIRSHSTTWSGVIQELVLKYEITHESNTFIPWQSNMSLKPWKLWNELTRVPYFWEDDVGILFKETNALSSILKLPGLRVFDFHPIHVFLNTESLDRYERTRHLHQNPKELIKYRFDGYGTRSKLVEFLRMANTI